MKKRNFIALLASAPLLGLFKAEEPLWWNQKNFDGGGRLTAEKMDELMRWALKRRIKPLTMPDGKEYFIIVPQPGSYYARHCKKYKENVSILQGKRLY